MWEWGELFFNVTSDSYIGRQQEKKQMLRKKGWDTSGKKKRKNMDKHCQGVKKNAVMLAEY